MGVSRLLSGNQHFPGLYVILESIVSYRESISSWDPFWWYRKIIIYSMFITTGYTTIQHYCFRDTNYSKIILWYDLLLYKCLLSKWMILSKVSLEITKISIDLELDSFFYFIIFDSDYITNKTSAKMKLSWVMVCQ